MVRNLLDISTDTTVLNTEIKKKKKQIWIVTFSYLVRMISDSPSLNKRQLVLCSEYTDFGCKTSLALITISALLKLDFS